MALPNQVSPPQIALSSAAPTGVLGADAVAVPLLTGDEGPTLGPGAAELLDEIDLDVFALLEHHKVTGKTGEVVEHPVLSREGLTNDSLRSVLLVGVGQGRPADLRKAGAALARRTKNKETVATSLAALSDDAGLRALVEGLVLGSFGFHRRSDGAKEQPVSRVVLAGVSDAPERQQALERALALAGAGWMARTLALVPANEKNPAWMAERATEVAKSSGLKVRVWDEKQLAREGFGVLTEIDVEDVGRSEHVHLVRHRRDVDLGRHGVVGVERLQVRGARDHLPGSGRGRGSRRRRPSSSGRSGRRG